MLVYGWSCVVMGVFRFKMSFISVVVMVSFLG